jgi:hypothetical protein
VANLDKPQKRKLMVERTSPFKQCVRPPGRARNLSRSRRACIAATRKNYHDMAATEKASIEGFHFPFPSAGYV